LYYPAGATTEDATIIDVRPGADISGIDVYVNKREDLYRIRGRVVDPQTGQPPSSLGISLYRRTDGRWQRADGGIQRSRADGSFEYSSLASGSYVMSVRGTGANDTNYGAKLAFVELSASNVDELVVPLERGVSVSGTVLFEGQRALPAPPDARVSLVSSDGLLFSYSQVKDGALRFDNVAAGEYRVQVNPMPADFYLKEAVFGGTDALHGTFKVVSGDINTLRVVLSSNVASAEGTVRNERLEPVAGSTVVFVPDRSRDRAELFQKTTTDADGHFHFASIPPGTYRAFAWEALEPFAYFDPEVLRQAEQKGKTLQLKESSKATIDLTAIPANR
jgi:hypothetical protein